MTTRNHLLKIFRTTAALSISITLTFSAPLFALAQEESSTGPSEPTGTTEPTGPSEPTGAPECTGASCHQGEDQGLNQGENQGANQGLTQGLSQGDGSVSGPTVNQDISADNTNTGADSTNTAAVTTTVSDTTSTTNNAQDTTNLSGAATTGENTSSQNSGDSSITSGNASIGVTQVKSDNTTVKDGDVVFSNNAHEGDIEGDLNVDFSAATSLLTGDGSVKSIQATNESTGSNSDNAVILNTQVTKINEVQNDGVIDNTVNATATTGDNHSDQNTGDATIATGNANVAASLVNLMNTTVENGNIIIATEDVYGDVQGDINIPDFNQLYTILSGDGPITVNAMNGDTGANSTNTIDANLNKTDTTTVNSEADIDTTINAQAVTGQNDSLANTGGAAISTGDGNVQASNVSVANTTVEDTSLGVVIINAFNRFVGFLIGSGNVATPLSEEETLTYIDADNLNTGSNSTNTITVNDDQTSSTTVDNDAAINNTINAAAITGRNTTNNNTGQGTIGTGDANVSANVVTVANTTVKNGNLAVVIINIFGDFLGSIFYGGTELALPYDTSEDVVVNAENHDTGANSTNTVTVDVTKTEDTRLNNSATLRTTLRTNIDTGNNRASRNTNGANITTGEGHLALLAASVANTVALGGPGGGSATLNGANDTTGANSLNTNSLTVTNNFSALINNSATAETFIPGTANTGHNELNQNTVGGLIKTGLIDASLSLGNMLNNILFALAPGDITLALNGFNHLTGSSSTNTNTLTYVKNWLLSIFNQATVTNLIDLLFNTGGNTANQNTAQAAIQTSSICVDGHIVNDLNSVPNTNGIPTTMTNTGSATTTAGVVATTGNNTLSQNTAGSTTSTNEPCPTPTPTPTPPPADNGGGGEGGGGEDGGEIAAVTTKGNGPTEAKRIPRIAGVTTSKFPGIGALGWGNMMKSVRVGARQSRHIPLPYIIIGSILFVASAAWSDHKHRQRKYLEYV